MKKSFFIIMLILIIITIVVTYIVYDYRTTMAETQKVNREYESYYNIDILGTELVSIINKTMDTNEKYQIEKDDKGICIENDTNSIKIYIQFIYKNDTKTIAMEDIFNTGVENFIKTYSTASFKCTDIDYHSKTHNIKSVTFTEVSETN